MRLQEHSTVREGLVTGRFGAVVVAVWYFLVDSAAGEPFPTPPVLGSIIFRGDLAAGVRRVVPGVVVGFGRPV